MTEILMSLIAKVAYYGMITWKMFILKRLHHCEHASNFLVFRPAKPKG